MPGAARYAAGGLLLLLGLVLLLVLAWRHGTDVGLAATGAVALLLGGALSYDRPSTSEG